MVRIVRGQQGMRAVLGIVMALLLSHAVGASATDSPFRLDNEQPYRHALDVIWARQPAEPAYPERMHQWLSEVMVAADRLRWHRLAEAAAKESVFRWSSDAPSMVGLSCYRGKQGRFDEAYADATKAVGMHGINPDWPRALQATWLWHLGKHAEADALAATIKRPTGTPEQQRLWIACRVFHLATTDPDSTDLPQLVQELAGKPIAIQWLIFLRRDVSFDRLREKSWFVTTVGATAEGSPPTVAFPTVQPDLEEDRLIALIPHSTIEADARTVLVTVQAQLNDGRWQDALDTITAHPGANLPELTFLKALAKAALDDAQGAMDNIRTISHDGIRMTSWTVDNFDCDAIGRGTLDRLHRQAEHDPSAARPLALALVIASHVPMAFRSYDVVVNMMNAAEQWCPSLAEVPNTRAIAEHELGNTTKAIADYQHAHSLNPKFCDPIMNLAYVNLQDEHLEAALAFADQGKAMGAVDPIATMDRAVILTALDRPDEAVALLEELANARPPTHRLLPIYCWEAASRCSDLRHFAQAQRMMRLILQVAPERTDAWTKLSGDLARAGRYDEALKAAQTALDVGDPDAVDGRIAVATWTFALGRHNEARRQLQLVDEPDSNWGRRLFNGSRAIFAAVAHDEDLLQRSIEAVIALKGENALANARWDCRWIRGEFFLDPYRDRPWFQDILKRAEARCHPVP